MPLVVPDLVKSLIPKEYQPWLVLAEPDYQKAVKANIECVIANVEAIMADFKKLPIPKSKKEAETGGLLEKIETVKMLLSKVTPENILQASQIACEIATKAREIEQKILKWGLIVGGIVVVVPLGLLALCVFKPRN